MAEHLDCLCVLGQVINLSERRFVSSLKQGKDPYLAGRGLDDILHVRHLAQYVAYSEHLIKAGCAYFNHF